METGQRVSRCVEEGGGRDGKEEEEEWSSMRLERLKKKRGEE